MEARREPPTQSEQGCVTAREVADLAQKLGLVGVQKPAQAGGRHGDGPGGGESAELGDARSRPQLLLALMTVDQNDEPQPGRQAWNQENV